MTKLSKKEFQYLTSELGSSGTVKCRVCPCAQEMRYVNGVAHSKTEKHKLNVKLIQSKKESNVTFVPPPSNSTGGSQAGPSTLTADDMIASLASWEGNEDNIFDLPSEMSQNSILDIHRSIAEAFSSSNNVFEHSEDHFQDIDDLEDDVDPSQEVNELSFEDICMQQALDQARPSSNILPKLSDQSVNDGEWDPYPSRAMFLTDLLFNSPHLRFSRAQKKAVLRWATDLGATEVPSLTALETLQNKLAKQMGQPTVEKKTREGDIYYLNNIHSSISKDMSNPLVRPYLQFYPVNAGRKCFETWHGSKWLKELPDDLLTPMVVNNAGKHFYINELCRCIDGSWFIPLRWVQDSKSLTAEGFGVFYKNFRFTVKTKNRCSRRLEDLELTYPELVSTGQHIEFSDFSKEYAQKMPHPKRIKAEGRPVYSIPVILFIDDVSANTSKQWNKNYVVYMSNASLPRQHLDEEYNVHFIGASPNAAPLELIHGVRELLEASEGILAYDCVNQCECMISAYLYLAAGDNPMQAELACQCGLTANKFCRTCHVGGNQAYKREDEGYSSLFQPSRMRTPQETTDTIESLFQRALLPQSGTAIDKLVRESGVKDTLAQPVLADLITFGNDLWKKKPSGMTKESYTEILHQELKKITGATQNPLLDIPGFDIHKDTPTELLHTILLGVVKYFWGQTVYRIIQGKHFEVFKARLESVLADGLNIPRILASYMCQYRGSLIGKHFKTIVQVLPTIIFDLVPQDLLDAWLLLGRLTVLCWFPEIEDIDEYLDELQQVIDQFLTKSAVCAPSIIISKPKFHFLVHLPFFIRRFGPALLFATERYESFNTVFRLGCIYSNRQAPSRDSALTFASLERMKHIASGGWWYDHKRGMYVRCSKKILNTILDCPEYARLLGLSRNQDKVPGTYSHTLVPSGKDKKAAMMPFGQTLLKTCYGITMMDNDETIYPCEHIITQNSDKASIGSCVLIRKEDSSVILGLIKEIFLTEKRQGSNCDRDISIVVDIFRLSFERHPKLDMPQLEATGTVVIAHPKQLICVMNVQHNCTMSGCKTDGSKVIRQERKDTNKHKKIVRHIDERFFILNTSALHNNQYIREFLPATFPKPRIYYQDHTIPRLHAAAKARDKKWQSQQAKQYKEVLKALRKNCDTSGDGDDVNKTAETFIMGLGEPPARMLELTEEIQGLEFSNSGVQQTSNPPFVNVNSNVAIAPAMFFPSPSLIQPDFTLGPSSFAQSVPSSLMQRSQVTQPPTPIHNPTPASELSTEQEYEFTIQLLNYDNSPPSGPANSSTFVLDFNQQDSNAGSRSATANKRARKSKK